jgi:hypothetical protein
VYQVSFFDTNDVLIGAVITHDGDLANQLVNRKTICAISSSAKHIKMERINNEKVC